MGLSLRDLAERTGVSAPMLSQVERGETSPTLAVAAKIAADEPPGSPVRNLYEALERAAARHQEQERRDDEELDAGWV